MPNSKIQFQALKALMVNTLCTLGVLFLLGASPLAMSHGLTEQNLVDPYVTLSELNPAGDKSLYEESTIIARRVFKDPDIGSDVTVALIRKDTKPRHLLSWVAETFDSQKRSFRSDFYIVVDSILDVERLEIAFHDGLGSHRVYRFNDMPKSEPIYFGESCALKFSGQPSIRVLRFETLEPLEDEIPPQQVGYDFW